jgi:hypothetical protein
VKTENRVVRCVAERAGVDMRTVMPSTSARKKKKKQKRLCSSVLNIMVGGARVEWIVEGLLAWKPADARLT